MDDDVFRELHFDSFIGEPISFIRFQNGVNPCRFEVTPFLTRNALNLPFSIPK
jgi:hypothetical protein